MTVDETFDWCYQFTLHGDSPIPGKPKLWRGEIGDHRPSVADSHPTRNGVTQEAYDAHRLSSGQVARSVFAMEPSEQSAIYRDYFDRSHAGKLAALDKPKLALCHFATFFNTRPVKANQILQRAVQNGVKLTIDGVIGPKTLDAVATVDDREGAIRYIGQLLRFYRSLGGPNLAGWTLRVQAIQREVGV